MLELVVARHSVKPPVFEQLSALFGMKKKKKSFITTVVPRLQNSGAVWDDRMDF